MRVRGAEKSGSVKKGLGDGIEQSQAPDEDTTEMSDIGAKSRFQRIKEQQKKKEEKWLAKMRRTEQRQGE